MTWKDLDLKLDSHKAKEKQSELQSIAKAYHVAFTSVEGGRVLQDLVNRYIMSNTEDLGNAKNVEFMSGVLFGQAELVKRIMTTIAKAEEL